MAATKVAPIAQVDNRVNFGSLDFYVAGGGLPEGDYVWSKLQFQDYQAIQKQTGAAVGPPRLGVMITMASLTDPASEARDQFYSMGSNANKSWAPNVDDGGLSLISRPGGPATRQNDSTNWSVLLKSMYDAGLPEGILTNSLEPLIGVHVHMANVPEPEGRKSFKQATATGEAALEGQGQFQDQNRNNMIAVVMEIKDDGKPWEGTGGVPDSVPAKAANGKPQTRAQAAHPKTTPKPTAQAPKPAASTEMDDDDLMATAEGAVTDVLTKYPEGTNRTILRTQAFKALKATVDEDTANKVQNQILMDDAQLAGVLGKLGYGLQGLLVKPLA